MKETFWLMRNFASFLQDATNIVEICRRLPAGFPISQVWRWLVCEVPRWLCFASNIAIFPGAPWRATTRKCGGIYGPGTKCGLSCLQPKSYATADWAKRSTWEMVWQMWSSAQFTTRTWTSSPPGKCILACCCFSFRGQGIFICPKSGNN